MTSIQDVAVVVEEPEENSNELCPPVSENKNDIVEEPGKNSDVDVGVKRPEENLDVAIKEPEENLDITVKEPEENPTKVCPPVPENTDVSAVEEEPEENPDEVLAWLEADPLIASRYTDEDPEFAAESAAGDPEIPIVTKWYGKSRNSVDRRTQEMDKKRQHGRTSEGDRYNNHKRPRYEPPSYNNKHYPDYRHGHGGHHRSFSGPDHYNRDQRSYNSGPRHDGRDHRPYYGHESRDHNSYNSGPGYYGSGHRSSTGSGNGNSRDHHGRRDERRHDKCPPASER